MRMAARQIPAMKRAFSMGAATFKRNKTGAEKRAPVSLIQSGRKPCESFQFYWQMVASQREFAFMANTRQARSAGKISLRTHFAYSSSLPGQVPGNGKSESCFSRL